MFTAFALDGDIPALLRKGAVEVLGGLSDLFRGSLLFRRQGAQIPLRVNTAGRCILSVVDFRKGLSGSASKRPEASASPAYLVHKRPNLPNGGLHVPYTPEDIYRFETPRTFAACKAVIPRNVRGGSLTDCDGILCELGPCVSATVETGVG